VASGGWEANASQIFFLPKINFMATGLKRDKGERNENIF
jgi:hypothetical protein